MADTHDELTLLAHGIDKLHGDHVAVVGLGELLGGTVKSSSKAVTLWKIEREQSNPKSRESISEALTMVRSPETREETRSFPALAHTIVL